VHDSAVVGDDSRQRRSRREGWDWRRGLCGQLDNLSGDRAGKNLLVGIQAAQDHRGQAVSIEQSPANLGEALG